MVRKIPFLFCRYSLLKRGQPMSAKEQFRALRAIKGQYVAHWKRNPTAADLDTLSMKPSKMVFKGHAVLAWYVGYKVEVRNEADYIWAVESWEVSTAVYAAILTLNGLILALGWSAFSRIYESVCAPGFSTYLRDRALLSQYIFYIGWVHLWQLVAIIISAIGMLMALIDLVPLMAEQIFFGIMIGISCYAIHQASGAVTVMQDIVWYRSIFDAHLEDGGVVPIHRNRG